MSDRLMTPDEVAARLNVSKRTVYRWLEAGKVPGAVALPEGMRRVSRAQLERWLERLAQAGAVRADGALPPPGDQPGDQRPRLTRVP